MTRDERVALISSALDHLSVNELAQLLLDKATTENLKVTIRVKWPRPPKTTPATAGTGGTET